MNNGHGRHSFYIQYNLIKTMDFIVGSGNHLDILYKYILTNGTKGKWSTIVIFVRFALKLKKIYSNQMVSWSVTNWIAVDLGWVRMKVSVRSHKSERQKI